jgi:hypothetical protein
LYQERGMSRSCSRILVSAMAGSCGGGEGRRLAALARFCRNRAPRAAG